MKKRRANRPYYSARRIQPYAYPNAAEPSYFVRKLLDTVTAAVTCIGTITLMFYFLTI